MFRRWQKDAVGKYRTLESFNTFLARLSPISGPAALGACDPADLYAVLSVLHSKGRNPQLQVNNDPGFYYFVTDAAQPAECDGAAAAPSGRGDGGACAAAPGSPNASLRREAVVPVSSKSLQLTTDTLNKFFQLEAHPHVSHILLATVDDDGSVSLVRVFNYVQPPFEGPETLPPLEAEGGGVGGESDDD